MSLEAMNAEMQRTAVQKKAVSKLSPEVVLSEAATFFNERGYKAGAAARPNHLFIMGGREGILPRVTGEISARADVGKPGTTLVTIDAVGERLGPTAAEFLSHLRQIGKTNPR